MVQVIAWVAMFSSYALVLLALTVMWVLNKLRGEG